MPHVYEIAIIESERGWGSKVEDYVYTITLDKADKFVEDYNSKNNSPVVPDWYMYADKPVMVNVSEEDYNLILSGSNSRGYIYLDRKDKLRTK